MIYHKSSSNEITSALLYNKKFLKKLSKSWLHNTAYYVKKTEEENVLV
jgi:hypothetical protein